MRAAIVTEYSRTPEVGERPEPEPREGRALLELRAAAINPADLAVASGRFPFGSPPMPYVPGMEGVATVLRSSRFAEGTVVFGPARGLGIGFDGTFSARFAAPEEILAEVPSGASDQLAATFGVAALAGWMPLSIVAPVRSGESVLILGATVCSAASRSRPRSCWAPVAWWPSVATSRGLSAPARSGPTMPSSSGTASPSGSPTSCVMRPRR